MANLPSQNNRSQTAGTGFVNLQRVLQANKNNQLGQTVVGGVQQAGNAARGALNQAGQQFQAGLNQEKERLGQEDQRVSRVLGNLPSATDEDVKAFESIRSGESKAPTGLKDTQDLRAKAQEAQMLGQAGGSEAGRFGLLQRFVGRGQQYTGGQQRLDNLLLGQQGGKQLQQARAGTIGLGGQVERGIQGAAARGQEGSNMAKQLAESTIQRLGGAVGDYDAAMQQQLANKRAAIDQILGQFSGTGTNAAIEVDPNRLAQLKEASNNVLGEGTQLFNADISPFVKANELFATKQGAQSAEDFAKAKMLGQLSGQSLAGQDSGNLLQEYLGRENLVGSYDANNPFSVTSVADLNKSIQDKKNEFNTIMANAANLQATNEAQLNAKAGQFGPSPGLNQTLRDIYNREHIAQAVRGLGQGLPGGVEQNPAFQKAKQELQFKNPTYQEILNRAGEIALGGNLPQDDESIKAWAGLAHTGPLAHVPATLRAKQEVEKSLAEQKKIQQDTPGQFNVLRALKARQG